MTTINQGWNLENSYASLPNLFFTHIDPQKVSSPKLIIFNESLASSLGFCAKELKKDGVDIFAGNRIPEGGDPLAQAYAGHQFGHFNMLGDGRAVLLGEQITPAGERLDVQLKGSGRTPYSRGGDGRAALGPMLREYIISEAMEALGIPTTRSLAVVTTGEPVYRQQEQHGAIVTRLAASHIRVGTFQYAASWGKEDDLRALADYTIKRHFPTIDEAQNRYLSLLKEVVKRQALLISKWQLVGFIHGVMNTDNMAISGETIDYGPCAFMDRYDPATVFSSIDRHGRYAYGNQPQIGAWNLSRFAETLLPLLHENEEQAIEIAKEAISEYADLFSSYWFSGMRAKLGIFNEETEDEALFENLHSIMKKNQADYTNTFRALTFFKPEETGMYCQGDFVGWYELWQQRLQRQEQSKLEAQQLMEKTNPAVIPRNHKVEEALERAEKDGDYTVMDKLLDVLAEPFTTTEIQMEYKMPSGSTTPYRTFCGT